MLPVVGGDDGAEPGDLLAEARRRYPDNKLLWWVDAAANISAGRYAEALTLLDRLLAVDPDALDPAGTAYDARIFGEYAYEARGVCLLRLERYAEASAAFEQAASLDPSNLGYRTKGRLAAARAHQQAEARSVPRPPGGS